MSTEFESIGLAAPTNSVSVECEYCHNLGHTAKTCKVLANVKCSYCGKNGHNNRYCNEFQAKAGVKAGTKSNTTIRQTDPAIKQTPLSMHLPMPVQVPIQVPMLMPIPMILAPSITKPESSVRWIDKPLFYSQSSEPVDISIYKFGPKIGLKKKSELKTGPKGKSGANSEANFEANFEANSEANFEANSEARTQSKTQSKTQARTQSKTSWANVLLYGMEKADLDAIEAHAQADKERRENEKQAKAEAWAKRKEEKKLRFTQWTDKMVNKYGPEWFRHISPLEDIYGVAEKFKDEWERTANLDLCSDESEEQDNQDVSGEHDNQDESEEQDNQDEPVKSDKNSIEEDKTGAKKKAAIDFIDSFGAEFLENLNRMTQQEQDESLDNLSQIYMRNSLIEDFIKSARQKLGLEFIQV